MFNDDNGDGGLMGPRTTLSFGFNSGGVNSTARPTDATNANYERDVLNQEGLYDVDD